MSKSRYSNKEHKYYSFRKYLFVFYIGIDNLFIYRDKSVGGYTILV